MFVRSASFFPPCSGVLPSTAAGRIIETFLRRVQVTVACNRIGCCRRSCRRLSVKVFLSFGFPFFEGAVDMRALALFLDGPGDRDELQIDRRLQNSLDRGS